jgi:hypothetical protein
MTIEPRVRALVKNCPNVVISKIAQFTTENAGRPSRSCSRTPKTVQQAAASDATAIRSPAVLDERIALDLSGVRFWS